MALTPEQIKELYTKPVAPTPPAGKSKFIRIERQYPRLPEDGNVRQTADTKRCASRGCSSPTHFTYTGVPYCVIHMIYYLAIENTALIHANCDKSQEGNVNGSSGTDHATRLFAGQDTL
jgi:hypothetical protein